MATNYVINKTNGSILTTVQAGTADNTTDLTLIGKGYLGFGEAVNENFVKLLENFANSTAPDKPLSGQIWYDSANSLVKYYDGSNFKQTAAFYFEPAEPDSPVEGEFWFNTVTNKFFVYYNDQWKAIGEDTVTLTRTGFVSDVVTDTAGVDHRVGYIIVNDKRVAYLSSDDTFTPQTAISNFAQIKKGVTLTTEGLSYFHGSSTSSLTLYDSDTSTNLSAGQFLRSDVTTTATGPLRVTSSVRIGNASNFRLESDGSANGFIYNAQNNKNIVLKVTKNNIETDVIVVNGLSGKVGILKENPAYELDVQGSGFFNGNLTVAGTLVGTTAAAGTNSTRVATTAFVQGEKVSPVFSGTPRAPTAAIGTNTTQIATTAFVQGEKASPVFTGVPTAPTASEGTSTTQIATTAFVLTATNKWGGSVKYVSTSAPTSDQGSNGDFWFQREA